MNGTKKEILTKLDKELKKLKRGSDNEFRYGLLKAKQIVESANWNNARGGDNE